VNEDSKELRNVIEINEARIKEHLDERIRDSVEETLNKMLDAEADLLCNAKRYEHAEARKSTRAGHYQRTLQTRVGAVELQMPKLRQLKFETAIIERYRRREGSVRQSFALCLLAAASILSESCYLLRDQARFSRTFLLLVFFD